MMLRALPSLALSAVGLLAAAQDAGTDARKYVQFVQDNSALCVSRDGVEIEGAETVAISFPGFFDLLDSLAQR